MNRAQAYEAIDKERTSQDVNWANREQYSRSAPHILLLEEQVTKLRSDWYKSERDALLERIIKVAAIAVRALEEIDPLS